MIRRMTADVFRTARAPMVPPEGMELHAGDLTATFGAGVTLGQAQAALDDIGQWLPIDGDPQASIGQLISYNSTGPLRLGYGAWRDLLLGVQFINGQDELISAGGRTVKNVAGYDLTKFIVGSAGVFGKIVTATVRTYKKPAGALLVRHALARMEKSLSSRLMPTPLRPQWAMRVPGALRCGYLGDGRTLDFYRTALAPYGQGQPVERSVEEDQADRARLWRADGPQAFRATLPPTALGAFTAALGATAWVADEAFGIVLGSNVPEDQADTIRAAAATSGGTLRLIRADAGAGATIDFSTNPVERQIIEQLKQAFDPDGKLNPLPWQPR